jgi:hypothetical protein
MYKLKVCRRPGYIAFRLSIMSQVLICAKNTMRYRKNLPEA